MEIRYEQYKTYLDVAALMGLYRIYLLNRRNCADPKENLSIWVVTDVKRRFQEIVEYKIDEPERKGVLKMSRVAFIFPGQGAQIVGMGKDFYEKTETAKKVYDKATELLGFSMPELCFEKNDRLDITEYTQAAMVTTSIAMMKVLTEQTKIRPDVSAGLSLGEY